MYGGFKAKLLKTRPLRVGKQPAMAHQGWWSWPPSPHELQDSRGVLCRAPVGRSVAVGGGAGLRGEGVAPCELRWGHGGARGDGLCGTGASWPGSVGGCTPGASLSLARSVSGCCVLCVNTWPPAGPRSAPHATCVVR